MQEQATARGQKSGTLSIREIRKRSVAPQTERNTFAPSSFQGRRRTVDAISKGVPLNNSAKQESELMVEEYSSVHLKSAYKYGGGSLHQHR